MPTVPILELFRATGRERGGESAASARKSSRAAAMPSGTYSATSRSFGEWMFESGSAKPVMIVGMPLSASAGTIGSVPPERISSGPAPSARSNASRPSWIAGASGGDEAGRRRRPAARPRRSAPSGAASRSSRSTAGAISSTSWPGREPDREVRLRLDRQHGLLEVRRAALDAVHVDAPARPTCGGRTPRPRARRPAARPGRPARPRPRGSARHAGELLLGRRHDARAQRLGQPPVARQHAPRASASARAPRSARRRRTCPSAGRARRSGRVTWK